MVFANTLYFKARWAKPFNHQLTHQEPFFQDNDSTYSAVMMVDTGEYSYLKTPSFAMVLLPYITQRMQGVQLAMVILLPHTRGQLNNLLKDLNSSSLQTWLLGMKKERVQLLIPKFKIASSFDLVNSLSHLGMTDPFSDHADFSGITTTPLKIGAIKQKTYVEIDEEGTEATTATEVGMAMRTLSSDNPPISFTADHPFAYLILDQGTGTILFMGKVMNPNN